MLSCVYVDSILVLIVKTYQEYYGLQTAECCASGSLACRYCKSTARSVCLQCVMNFCLLFFAAHTMLDDIALVLQQKVRR